MSTEYLTADELINEINVFFARGIPYPSDRNKFRPGVVVQAKQCRDDGCIYACRPAVLATSKTSGVHYFVEQSSRVVCLVDEEMTLLMLKGISVVHNYPPES